MDDFTSKKKIESLYSYRTPLELQAQGVVPPDVNEQDCCFAQLKISDDSNAHRFVDGFYPIEEGKCRWMGRTGKVLIDVPLHTSDFYLKGYLPPTHMNGESLKLTISAEEKLLGQMEISSPGSFSLSLPITQESVSRPRRLVSFFVLPSRTFVPAQSVNGSLDVRELSVLVTEIGVRGETEMAVSNAGGNKTNGSPHQPYHPYFTGRCTICGCHTDFLLEDPTLIRESMLCKNCMSTNRNRQLARGLLRFLRGRGFQSRSIAELSEELIDQQLTIYDTDAHYPIARYLRNKNQLITSDYFPGTPSGALLGERHFCEDLSNISFSSESIDLVLSSDVLEHVRLYEEALNEIHRVLRPGGTFIFTVPFDSALDQHEVFIDVLDKKDPGKDAYPKPPVFHGDPLQSNGSALYRIYGRKLFIELEEAGFVVDYERSTFPNQGIYDCELFYCVKPEGSSHRHDGLEISEQEQVEAILDASRDVEGAVEPGGLIVDSRCRWLNIEFSSICNLRCRWCILDHEQPKRFLSLDSFERVLQQIANGELTALERIDLHNGGEALLHPKIDVALNLLAQYRQRFRQPIHVALLTNGTVLKESTLALLTSGATVDEIRVSVDGGSPEVFEYLRTNAKWRKVSENVRRISQALTNTKSKTTLGIICMVAPDKPTDVSWMDPNFKEVIQLADHLEIRHPHTWEGSLNGFDGLVADTTQKQKNRLCKFLKRNLVVFANGDVSVCCADLNGRGTIGTIDQQTLTEIANGGDRQHMIDLWQQGRFNEIPICSTCEGYYDEPATRKDDAPPRNPETTERALEDMTLAQLEEIAILDTKYPVAQNNLGVLHCQQGNHTKALFHFKQAVAANSEYIVAHKNLANLQEMQGRFDEAAYSYQCIISQEPDDIDALSGLGRLSIEASQFDAARHFFQRLLEIDATHAEATKTLDTLLQWERDGLIPTSSHKDRAAIPSNDVKKNRTEHAPALPVTRFTSLREFELHSVAMQTELKQRGDNLLKMLSEGVETFKVAGHCYVCKRQVDFKVDYLYGSVSNGVCMPNWRERLVCPACNLNNRIRASIQLFEEILKPQRDSCVYITEQSTPVYHWLKERYHNTVGSEYLGDKIPFGTCNGSGVRNESLTRLTFRDHAFDFVLSFEVFEHIPDFAQAFKECRRVLKDGGKLFFTVPFVKNSAKNITRAVVKPDGKIEHIMAPEYHGDPVNQEGCLAFRHFGWEMLDQLREAGFDDVALYTAWSDKLGYLGDEQPLFVARAQNNRTFLLWNRAREVQKR